MGSRQPLGGNEMTQVRSRSTCPKHRVFKLAEGGKPARVALEVLPERILHVVTEV